MEDWNKIKYFHDYFEYYPYDDEPDFDGVHSGGIKGIKENAPADIKEAFKKYVFSLMSGLSLSEVEKGIVPLNSIQRIYYNAWKRLLQSEKQN